MSFVFRILAKLAKALSPIPEVRAPTAAANMAAALALLESEGSSGNGKALNAESAASHDHHVQYKTNEEGDKTNEEGNKSQVLEDTNYFDAMLHLSPHQNK